MVPGVPGWAGGTELSRRDADFGQLPTRGGISPARPLSPLLPADTGRLRPDCLLCARGEVGGWRGERELRDTPRVLGSKPEAASVSGWFAGGTQKWLPVTCAASVKMLRFLLVLLSPDTDVGALGDTQPDAWPPS